VAVWFCLDRASGCDRDHCDPGCHSVAILLPAVQAAREQARRAACINNLKQIGLAIANYTNRHGTLPPGYQSIYSPLFQEERSVRAGVGRA
jgi:hypothetical protein